MIGKTQEHKASQVYKQQTKRKEVENVVSSKKGLSIKKSGRRLLDLAGGAAFGDRVWIIVIVDFLPYFPDEAAVLVLDIRAPTFS